MVVWITGLSGSGKTTIGKNIYEYLKQNDNNTVFLDGDIIRKALNNNYGYSLSDRLKGAKQVSGLCKMLDDEGINVVCSTMSLFYEIQESNRKDIGTYIEVFLDVDIEILKQRDSKSLYSKTTENVVGIDLSYDIPKSPELYLDNSSINRLDDNIKKVIRCIEQSAREKSTTISNKKYWEEYYKAHMKPIGNSSFAEFISDYVSNNGTFIELGCGNGRDSFYFSENFNLKITAVDQCGEEMKFLNKNYGNNKLTFIEDDFTRLENDMNYNCIYSRFTLHAVDEEAEDRTLQWICKSLLKNGLFFLEARSIKDELFGEGSRVGKNEYVTDHYRRFLDINVIENKIKELGLSIVYSIESQGLAIYKNENPIIIRIIAKKV